MSTVSRSVAICALLVFSVSLCAAVGVTAASATDSEGSLPTVGSDGAVNETVPHQDPEEYDDQTDAGDTESWLEGQLGDRLEDSSFAISEGQYDLAQDLLGEDYEEQFGQYVAVSGDTGGTDSDEDDTTTADLLEETGQEQQRQAELLDEYNETLAEYEQAVQMGEEDQARDLARDLNELAEEIDSLSEQLDRYYDQITIETERDFTETRDSISETNAETQETQSTIRQTEFVQTNLHLEPESQSASFTDPVTVSGEIETADDSPLENEDVQFNIANTTVTTQTDDNGFIEFTYRPTMASVSAESIPIEYVPNTQSTYLGSETELNITVEQTEPQLTVADSSEEVAYGDEVGIDGELFADGSPIDEIPLGITLGGEVRQETVVENGSFSSSVTVPGDIEDGEQSLGAVFSVTDRALAPTEANTSVMVLETDTELSIDPTIEEADNGTEQLAISGSFETIEGDGIANESIALEIGGTSSETVMTETDGSFSAIIETPSDSGDEIEIGASYDGAGSNFAPTTTEHTIVQASESSLLESNVVRWIAIGGVVGLLAVIGIGIWFRQRETDADQPSSDTPTDVSNAEPSTETEFPVESLLSAAGNQLSSGRPDIAVRNAYTAVRNTYEMETEQPDRNRSLTHWEFHDRYQSTATDGPHNGETLRSLTEAYERAAFTSQSVSTPEAESALEAASVLCDLDGALEFASLSTESAE